MGPAQHPHPHPGSLAPASLKLTPTLLLLQTPVGPSFASFETDFALAIQAEWCAEPGAACTCRASVTVWNLTSAFHGGIRVPLPPQPPPPPPPHPPPPPSTDGWHCTLPCTTVLLTLMNLFSALINAGLILESTVQTSAGPCMESPGNMG